MLPIWPWLDPASPVTLCVIVSLYELVYRPLAMQTRLRSGLSIEVLAIGQTSSPHKTTRSSAARLQAASTSFVRKNRSSHDLVLTKAEYCSDNISAALFCTSAHQVLSPEDTMAVSAARNRLSQISNQLIPSTTTNGPLRVSIIGSGNWGTAVAKIVAENTHLLHDRFAPLVKMWMHEETVKFEGKDRMLTEVFNETHQNVK